MHASDKKQASPVAVRFAFLFATAAFLTGAVAQTGRDEVVPPGGENEPPVLLDIEPIPGLTTRRHRIVPEEPVPLPLGSRLVLRASPSTVHLLPASYRWLGARELEDGDGVSTACFRASSVGLHEVRVVPRILGAEPEPLQVRIRVLPVKASEIRVRVRKPDKLVTFIGDELSWQVETQPAEFARLVEWKAPTMRPAFGFGPVFRTRGSRPGRSHPITASIGPRASPTPVQPILYKVQWVSKPAKSDYFQSTPTIRLYHEIKTIPAGYEDLVPWTYDTIGTGIASATTGRGRSFTVVRSHFRWHRLLCWRVRAGNLEERRDFFNKVVESLFQKRANQPEKNRQEGREPDPCSSSVPITFSNGEATVTAVDLRVPSRGFDFVWQRTYSSRADFPGPGGHNWALNYNQRIATVPGAKSVSFIDGSLREDIFQFAKSLGWVSPPGYYDRLVRKIDLSYERIDRDGTTYRFDSNGWLVSITDRTGKNTLRIQRNSHSNIVEIVDTQDRVYTVSYTNNSATQKVAALTDFRGRTIRYSYDVNGDLVRVRSPIVLNTPNGNDFPNGKTTLYSYSSGSTDSRLNHNLLSIVEPLYNVANDPRQSKPLATMTYASTTDPTAVDFDHVVAERWGHDQGGPPRNPGIKVGGTSTFAYSRDLKSDPLAPGTAVHKTIETTRNGNVRVHYFDVADREIRRIEQTNRNVRPGEGDYITDFSFTDEGLLRQVIYPRLNVVMREYDLTNPRRQSQKNLLEVRRQVGRVGGGLVDLVTRYTYEPVFNRLRTVTDPRGFPKGTVPKTSTGHLDLRNPCVARYTTTRFFDYQEGTGFQAGRGIVAAERIPEGLGDLNGAPDFEAGNVVKIAHPKIQTPGPNLGQIIEEKFTWNQHAQMLTRKDPEDQVTKLDYFPSNTKPRDPSDLEGYLQARTEDANGFALKTILDYDIVGNITGITDPKGQRTDFVVNQLNQLVRTLSRPVKAAGFRYRVDRFYDANDNLVKTETQNLDEKGNAYAHNPIVKTRDYDILHNLVAVSDDKTRNDGTLAGQVTTEFFYDAHLNRTAVKYPKPLGTRVATIVTTQYDERELPYKVITGDNDTNPYNSPPATAVIATTNYDPNRNLLETIDTLPQTKRSQVKTKFPGSAPGDVTLFEYDGFDRLTKTTDGEANLHERAYDLASNLAMATLKGPEDHTSSAKVRVLKQRSTVYDELDRVVRTDDLHTDAKGAAVGDGNSTTTFRYDAESKLLEVLDDRKQRTMTIWDDADRVSKVVDELKNEIGYVYDRNDNVTTRIDREISTDLSSPPEVFTTTMSYDGVDRLVKSVDPAGDINEFFYDARDNVVKSSDGVRGTGQAGNLVLRDFDALDRLVRTERVLTSNGRGNGTVTGRIVTTQTWDDDSLILARTDDNKNATRYGYDNLRRLTRISYADTTTRTTTYNTDNQLIGWTDQNGTIATMRNVDYDGLSRLRLRKVTPATGVKGCTEERFFYDGASRATLIQNNDIFSRTAFMSCVFGYDSLDNRTLDQQATWRVDSVFDGVSNRVRCTYPGDFGGPGRRQLSGVFDRLNRLRSVSDSAGVIATMHYKGPTRLERRTYGVDATPISKLDCGYDKLPRLIDMVHQTGASQLIAGFQYGHDRMHHRLFEKRVHQGNSGDVYAYDSIYRVAANKQKVNLSAVSAGQEILPENFSSRDSLAYSYDGAGNRDKVVKTVNNVPTTTVYTHNNMNKYASVKEGSKAAQLFKCDNNGNPISDGTRTYAYDFKNRLVEVSQGTKILVQYSYDAIDRRPKKVLDPKGTTPTTVIYLYDGQQVVEERDGKGNLLRQFVWGAGVDQLCQYKTGKLAAQTFYAHENAIGSIAALVDGAGKTVERYDYDPFGNTTVTLNGSSGNEYRFHAARFDPETGLYHMRARHYSPSLGRFFQRDPIGIWTDDINLGNGYGFVGNDPVNARDPSGRWVIVVVWAPWVWPMYVAADAALACFKPGYPGMTPWAQGASAACPAAGPIKEWWKSRPDPCEGDGGYTYREWRDYYRRDPEGAVHELFGLPPIPHYWR